MSSNPLFSSWQSVVLEVQGVPGAYDIALVHPQGKDHVLAQGYKTVDDVLDVLQDALTAPLASEERLKTYDEAIAQVQTLFDTVQEMQSIVSGLAAKMDVIQDLFVQALQRGAPRSGAVDPAGAAVVPAGHPGSGSPSGPAAPRPSLRPPLRRPVAVPHHPAGGAYRPGEGGLLPEEEEV